MRLYGIRGAVGTKNTAEDIIKKCIKELKTRFSINMVDFDVFKITKNGIEDISDKFNKK